jgi:NADP-dependent 3-hydroxy acid dehydrogenase YdfG
MVSAAQESLGPIDVLINNAGVFPRVPNEDAHRRLLVDTVGEAP